MLPFEIPERSLSLPLGDRNSAVIITGPAMREQQFGYKLQQRFPGLAKKWWMIRPVPAVMPHSEVTRNSMIRMLQLLAKLEFRSIGSAIRRRLLPRDSQLAERRRIHESELRIFADDIRQCSPAEILPTEVATFEDIEKDLSEIRPYLLLSLGGPLIPRSVYSQVRGLAINQHSGWSPEYKGARTVWQTLYYRDPSLVGNTVHLVDSGADSGAIFRRSSAMLHPDDTDADCVMASIALGTELAMEVVQEVLQKDALLVYDQPFHGTTFLSGDWTDQRRVSVASDFQHSWLAEAIDERRNW